MTEAVTIEDGDNSVPALAVDAIGGEPASILAGEFHVQIHTWHGVTPPYTANNAQVLYLTPSAAYEFGEALMAAADEVVNKSIDRRERK
jgi:hypothetical protein